MQTMLRVAAVCVRDDAGRLLTVRKRGTVRFMLPGGKLEAGESPAQAAARELAEEVGIVVPVADLLHLGSWEAPAANEPDTLIDSTVYTASPSSPPRPRAAGEIDELRWLDLSRSHEHDDLAPMLDLYVIPALRSR